jgi:hypothetical protein
MWALICERAGDLGVGLHDIAGRPLLIRQLQWLRDNHIEHVVVEVCAGPHAARLAPLLLGSDPLLDGCTILPSAAPLGPQALALRAGVPAQEPLLVLPSDLLVGASLPTPCPEARYRLQPLAGAAHEPLELCVAVPGHEPTHTHELAGWAMRIASPAVAHAASCAVLMGRAPGVLVHAAEVRHGVWLGRGAQVAPSAQLQPPVLVGAEARVLHGATLGPEVIVGPRSVVERRAHLTSASLAEDTLVGERSELRGVHVRGGRVERFADGEVRYSADPLQLMALARAEAAIAAKLTALALLAVLLLPWLALAAWGALRGKRALLRTRTPLGSVWQGGLDSRLDCVPRLLDVLRGRRDLLGAVDPALLDELGESRPAALDVGAVLAPAAQPDTRRRMLRWYRWHKRPGLDLRIGLHALLRALTG